MASTTEPLHTEGRRRESPYGEGLNKPRVHRRGSFEYLAWLTCALVAFGVGRTLLVNENYQWGVVA